jgi:serine/threonine protein kinase
MTGRVIAHYEILDRLADGGMGEIYRARDKRLNRLVAIKVLPSAGSNDDQRKRRDEKARGDIEEIGGAKYQRGQPEAPSFRPD